MTKHRYRSLLDLIIHHDYFLVTADFEPYYAKQREVDTLWSNRTAWWQASILNTARVGWFCSDRTVREYADEIWNVPVGPCDEGGMNVSGGGGLLGRRG
jgi:starch phosphorylase